MSPAMDPAVELTLRAGLALLLGSAAGHKLRDLAHFRLTLQAYEVLPPHLVSAGAAVIVAMELAAAALVLLGVAPQVVAPATALLLAGYAAAIAVNLRRGREGMDCGCAGPAARVPISPALVVRNLLLATAAASLALPASPRALVWVDVLTVTGALGALCACWMASERMLALAPSLARLRMS